MMQERFVLSERWRTLLALSPHRPRQAAAIAWWWLTGRRVRALDRLRNAMVDHPKLYAHWLSLRQPPKPRPRVLAALRAECVTLPSIALHIHLVGESLANFDAVLAQIHRRWTLYVTVTGSSPSLPDDARIRVLGEPCPTRAIGLARVLKVANESHVMPLSADATLTPGALMAFARTAAPRVVLYADQDENGPNGRENPWLKPDWDENLFLAQDYLSDACAIPVDAAREIAVDPDWSDDIAVYALIMRLSHDPSPHHLQSPRFVHVPYIAVTTSAGHWKRERPTRADLVSSISGLTARRGAFGTLALARPLPSPLPKVSVIVPTRDRADLLRTCVEGVLHGTDYPALELVIADNDSIEQETLSYFAAVQQHPRVKIVHWPNAYNYSAINNFAVAQASGSYLCLLNNDTEVIDPAWLYEMMAHASRAEAGAVGARLLYPDRTIQHAGVVVGVGNAAGHAHRGQEESAPGYFAQAHVAREATAVTAACLVIARDKFEGVEGFDEHHLGVAYNDVDLCLKLRAAGWTNLYVPQAVMIHHESKSRGLDLSPEHRERYMRELAVLERRWGTVGFIDPTHHAALDPASEVYRLRL